MVTSAIFILVLVIIFSIHIALEAKAGDATGFRLFMRLIIDLAGIALVLYGICWLVVSCLTKHEMENYLVSEMFRSDGKKR